MGTLLSRQTDIADVIDPKQRVNLKDVKRRFRELEEARRPYETRWKSIQEKQLPFIGELYQDERDNPAVRKDTEVINGAAQMCANILSAGIMSGLTPVSRRWFKIELKDDGMDDDIESRQVLGSREELIESLLQSTNFYSIAYRAYQELPYGQFVTGSFKDKDKGIYFTHYTIGTYYIDSNSKGNIDTFGQKEKFKARHLQELFGYDNLSDNIKQAIDFKNMNQEFTVYWLVYPNEEYDPRSNSNVKMQYKSVYWVNGGNKPLYVGGFHEFPFHVGRWSVTGLKPYAKGPAWTAEGDNQLMQKLYKEIINGVELQNSPPLMVDADTVARGVTVEPAGINVVDDRSMLQPLYTVGLQIEKVGELARQAEERIRKYYSADLFLMLDQLQEGRMTATEVTARVQEKLQQLGPVVQNLQTEYLDGVIERIYNILDRAEMFEPIPDDLMEELDGQDLKIEYIAPLAQAQRVSGLVNIEQAMGFLSQMAQLYPEVLDTVNINEVIKKYYTDLSVPAIILRSDEEIQEIQQQRMEQQQEQQEAEMQMQMLDRAAPLAQAAKNISETVGENPAANLMMSGGYYD